MDLRTAIERRASEITALSPAQKNLLRMLQSYDKVILFRVDDKRNLKPINALYDAGLIAMDQDLDGRWWAWGDRFSDHEGFNPYGENES